MVLSGIQVSETATQVRKHDFFVTLASRRLPAIRHTAAYRVRSMLNHSTMKQESGRSQVTGGLRVA